MVFSPDGSVNGPALAASVVEMYHYMARLCACVAKQLQEEYR